MDPKWNFKGQCNKGNSVGHSLQVWQTWKHGRSVGCYWQGIIHIDFDGWHNKDHCRHMYNSHKKRFDSLEGPKLRVFFSRVPDCEGHVHSHCLHLWLQVLQEPTDYCVQIDFCYKNLIWVLGIHGKTSRGSRFLDNIIKHSCANVCLFVSL
jgi:hypothetical protein